MVIQQVTQQLDAKADARAGSAIEFQAPVADKIK